MFFKQSKKLSPCPLCSLWYAETVLKFEKLNTQAQQRGAVVQGRSLPPYRLRYKN
ncbi:MAG: hypothetical protein LBK06_07705 [Planctomycetaceae bacterium]|nr:hypothetical protein [Planctomycetaceae bacterium]